MSAHEFDVAYRQAAIRAGKGGASVFGLRLMRENLDELSAILDGIFPDLPSDKARFERPSAVSSTSIFRAKTSWRRRSR